MQRVIKVTESNAIKKKMMAATSMLLVAVIMLVSASYAWFTLSTAPEVTGITTAVGANGNLEMALANSDTWTGKKEPATSVGTSLDKTGVDIKTANESWGNLVDLSDTKTYGLNNIILMPSRLNYDGTIVNQTNLLKTPKYGSDGRIMELETKTVTGVYGETGFVAGDGKNGLRAVGIASAMTERQMIYRSALGMISTRMYSARNAADTSLRSNGSALAGIIVNHATAEDGTTETYSREQIEAISSMLASLTDSVNDIKYSLGSAVVAYAASNAGEKANISEEQVKALSEAIVAGTEASIDGNTVTIDTVEVSVNDNLKDAFSKYSNLSKNVSTASSSIATLLEDETKTSYEWSEISAALNSLVNPEDVTINDYTVDAFKTKIDEDPLNFGLEIASDGVVVTMPTGTGAYADIADLCGDYVTGITVYDMVVPGYGTIKELPATMQTDSDIVPPYLENAKTDATTAGEPINESTTDAVITDFYGYAMDMLFRTNATGSNLELQVDPEQRIYEGTENDATQGGGSNMTFKSTDNANFTTDDVKALMDAIRVVFTDNTGKILGIAVLDTANATTENSEVTADLKMCNYTITNEGVVTIDATTKFKTEQTISALQQNTILKVSAIVYLDGDYVTNAMVANAVSSMTGSMNLQFSSSAKLIPMDYTSLKGTGAVDEENSAVEEEVTNP